MKHLSIILLSFILAFPAISQNLDQINDLMGKMQFKEAKAGIDNYLLNPKKANDAEALYYKGRIYNSLSREESTSNNDAYDYKTVAFEAFKKYQTIDKKDVYMLLENHTSYLDLYYGFYDLGAKQFNGKNFEGAEMAFKKAIEVKDFILSKKYEYNQTTLYPIDTSLILNIAAAAIQSKKEDEAITYYKMLTDVNIAGADFKEIYLYMVDYYTRKDNGIELKNILAKAKKLYPSDDTWFDAEIKMASKSGNKEMIFSKYDELLIENPTSFLLTYNYAVELYNSLYGKEASHPGDIALSDKLTQTIKMAIKNEPSSDITATMLMTNHLYNMGFDLLNRASMIKSTKPEDIKKKTELKSIAAKSFDECIVYGELTLKHFESMSNKTAIQKANYKIVLGYLSEIYTQKKMPAKAAEYDKKNAAADKM